MRIRVVAQFVTGGDYCASNIGSSLNVLAANEECGAYI